MAVPYRSSSSADKQEVPTIVPDAYKKAEVKSSPKRTLASSRNSSGVKKQTDTVPTLVRNKRMEGEKTNVKTPVFKVQILVSSRVLRKGDAHFKGEEGYDSYQEGGMYKYTIGASENYNEIYKLRKSLLEKFPEAFIIAFKDGQKCDVNQAIREYKQNKQK